MTTKDNGKGAAMHHRARMLLWMAGLVAGGGILCGGLLFVVDSIFTPPMAYAVHAEFEELPLSDEELEQWLLSQPGVYIGSVGRTGNTVSLVWGNCGTNFRDPVTPDLRPHFERFGYKGLKQYQEEKAYRDK